MFSVTAQHRGGRAIFVDTVCHMPAALLYQFIVRGDDGVAEINPLSWLSHRTAGIVIRSVGDDTRSRVGRLTVRAGAANA